MLGKDAVSAPDDTTVVFELDAPNGNWPYLVSSDNYNAIILPETFDGDWETTWTGPWKLGPGEGQRRVFRNENYWE